MNDNCEKVDKTVKIEYTTNILFRVCNHRLIILHRHEEEKFMGSNVTRLHIIVAVIAIIAGGAIILSAPDWFGPLGPDLRNNPHYNVGLWGICIIVGLTLVGWGANTVSTYYLKCMGRL